MKIASFSIRCVSVPMPQPHRTASGVISASPLEIRAGNACFDEVIGTGVEFNEVAVQRMLA